MYTYTSNRKIGGDLTSMNFLKKILPLTMLIFCANALIGCGGGGSDAGDGSGNIAINETGNDDGLVRDISFPGAVGYGRKSGVGQPRRDIVYVTNLNDSGLGSFREALSGSDRYVLFKVAGTITLHSQIQVNGDNIYIAGQTAFQKGGGGITLRANGNYNSGLLAFSGDHIILRHLRLRRGPGSGPEVGGDNINFFGDNWIVDHVSFSWSTDENISAAENSNGTIQNSISSEGLYFSSHAYSTDATNGAYQAGHSKGGLIGYDGAPSDKITFYRNIFAHNDGRNPQIISPGGRFEVVNNLMYNNRFFNVTLRSLAQDTMETNVVKNLFIAGEDTRTSRHEISIIENTMDRIYVQGNIGWNRTSDFDPEWNVVGNLSNDIAEIGRSNTPFRTALSNTYTDLPDANELKGSLLPDAGASIRRDVVDIRVINDIRDGTPIVQKMVDGVSAEWSGASSYFGIINDPAEVGGWPNLASMASSIVDFDEDGMLDSWEISNFGNLSKGAYGDADNDGLPNIEEFLESCCT